MLVHAPPHSSGYQGSNQDVRDALSPIFAQHGVQLVLSGHEHDYERSVPIDGVTYVVSGAAAGARRTGTEDYTAYAAATPSFVEVNVFADRLVLRVVDHDARMFDEAVIAR